MDDLGWFAYSPSESFQATTRAVNIASRMESHGIDRAIQVSEAVHQKLKSHYPFEIRGRIEIKGKKAALMAYIYILRPIVSD